MSCCPATAWGELKNTSYKPKGVVEDYEGFKFYRSGQSHKCIIWNYDVFGFNGGRTKQMVDFLADNGYMVILPDYYRGKMVNPMTTPREELVEFVKNETQWEGSLKNVWEEKIRPYAVQHGAKIFGSIGTCWGSYMVLRLSSYVDFRAGISMHPSHTPICAMLGLDEEALLKEVKCPQMFMPAGDDHENVRIGGLGKKVLTDGVEIVEFPDMKHGWSTKGDLSVPAVERDVKKTFNFVLAFFGKYLH